MRIGFAFTPFLPYPHKVPFSIGRMFESGEQIYPVNNSPGVDTCEQPVWVGL